MKKYAFCLTVLFTLLLLFNLCACGKTSADSTEYPTVTEPPTETVPPVPETPASEFLCEENDDGGITVLKYKGSDKNIVIPAIINGKPVTAIGKTDVVFPDAVSIAMPDTVREIRDKAFAQSADLTSVVLSKSLTKIGQEAFRGCSSLSDVTLPDSLTYLGAFSFSDCSALRSISLPQNLSEVNNYAFYHSGLETVSFREGLQIIRKCAFGGTPLKKILLPDSVKEIQLSAFDSCTELETITFGKGLEKIGTKAFFKNIKLTEIALPASLTTVFDTAFEQCTALKRIMFEGNAPTVVGDFPNPDPLFTRDYTVCYRSTAQGFTYPEWQGFRTEITDVDTDSPLMANSICTEGNYEYFLRGGGTVIFRYHGTETDAVIPATLGGKMVIGIGNSAFLAKETLVSVEMPDTVTSIGSNAFENCQNLTSVKFSSSLESLGSKAFSCCVNLSDPQLPDTLCVIGTMAFAYCRSLKDLCIPAAVKTLEPSTFYFSTVQTVDFAKNSRLETIFPSAFAESDLREITVPASVKSVTESSFDYCPMLQFVYFEGDAPADFGTKAYGVTFFIFYHQDAKGFTSPEWNGHKTEIW